ncbi:RidA family protein [Pseudotamlana agarivorans]|uniref:RidA family protein n=1 Tax=Pseudotamlana agarivorans TaxID=481183 RepID=UPI00082D59D0|nr:RidA family protein [Tamlana agarivorans]
MERRLISSKSDFENKIGYSRAVVQNGWVFVSGTTGYNYETMRISDDVVEQTEQCFVNIIKALEEAGASLKDTVRVTYILPEAEDFKACRPVLNKYFGDIKPAATMISAGLADDKMKIEIQITALKG